MKKAHFVWKKSVSVLLSALMLVSTVQFVGTNTKVEAAPENGSFISMPITIRDFAADGMLFEFNQVGKTGVTTVGETASMNVKVNPSTFNNDNYSWVCVVNNKTSYGNPVGKWWLDIYCNKDGSVNRLYKSGASVVDNTIPSGGMYIAVHSNCENYNILDQITDSNKSDYKFSLNGSTLTMTVGSGESGTYNQADTAGFSMLSTTDKDYINNLPADESETIAGTDLIQNGTWGLKTDPDPQKVTLTSGASQEVYGAWIRTDLVEDKLDADGKPVYTEAAVKYIAEYMQRIMAVPEQNADGSYNTYFVTGHKLSQLDKEDLAAKIRAQVAGNSLGTYDDAKAKFESGSLREYKDIATWYDAAYFLLHNTWRDSEADTKEAGSDGYGMLIDNYKNLHMIQTTNDDGEICYVFNSKYDDTRYDYVNGEIYNTQTDNFTIAKTNSGTESYVRGNALPEARFDPLGVSGTGANYGYGMSGDTYGDMVSESEADWADYYDNTNYHLSLEGHAQFIYYEDSNLYFTFTGDDDVYLFINGVRVLDVGAAHSISKVKITLNDVAEICGLKDGQAYDFDFYYMERHGTAANFGIETNIRIVDPAMTTTKTGYQNGVSTGYNGFVNPLLPVTYEFALENKGEADIQNLTFTDDDIGVTLKNDYISLNSETTIDNLSVTVYNANGTVKESIAAGSLTNEKLMELLSTGLAVNEKIIIYGFNYIINNWNENNAFPNTVYTTAVSIGENNSTHNLNGMASWLVQKAEYEVQGFHVYEWCGKGVTLTNEELLDRVADVVGGFDPDRADIEISTATGATTGVNVNTKAKVNNGEITYTGTTTGVDNFFYKVTEGTVTVIIPVAVYSYDVTDNTYVLDYGLSVELNGDDFGLRVNDTLDLADNPNPTTAKVTEIQDATSNYGTFTWADPSLKYEPTDIIDNIDSVQANVQVLEEGATELTKFTGVEMYETITTAPANVVYYEENHPGITYVNAGENNWAHYETVDDEGNSVAGTEQSADQDSNYGSDPNYAEDKVGTIVSGDRVGTVIESTTLNLDTSDLNALQASGIEFLNEYLGLGGSDSNGTVNQLVVNTTEEVMYFDFVGTGFEILSRTTDEQYAVINVQVQKVNVDKNGEPDGTYTIVRQKPVITESKGGDLYQVPIISITGLEKAEYRVVVKAAGSTANTTRVLYIDGIRIYGPLSDDEALEYYNPEEYQAEFFEIKQLIENGQMIYADASETDDDLQLVTGTTLIEDVEGNGVLTAIESVDLYMSVGPNNELYLDGNNSTGMIAFFLTPIETDEKGNAYPEGARTIEIGAHRKSDSTVDPDEEFSGNGYVKMIYGSTAADIVDVDEISKTKFEISTGTEMYYTIDVNKLVLRDGKYLVMIGTNGSENYFETLALTNIKVAGYEISFAETQVVQEFDEYGESDMVNEIAAVFNARNIVEEEPEVIEIPVNENLVINSASYKAAKVVSGKVATLTVKATAGAETIVITDASGAEIPEEDIMRSTCKVASNGIVTFTVIYKVYGSRGDVLDFNIRVFDADGLASVNTETRSITIK